MTSTQEEDESNLNPDGTRKFVGLQNLKKSRLDRHIKTLDEFTKKQGESSEEIEQKLLIMSREVRENVADVDKTLEDLYKSFKDAKYMTSLSEAQVFGLLEDVKRRVQARSDLTEAFAVDLDGIEESRAEVVSVSLKQLTDTLIGIAHLLPAAIEKIIEAESYDLNIVLTTNRASYDELMSLLRSQQIDCEANGLQLWEDARAYWRQLRHDKALQDFDQDIHGDRFEDPQDRRDCMAQVRQGQKDRHDERLVLLAMLSEMNTITIDTKKIVETQDKFSDISQREVDAIQSNYDSLGEFRENLRLLAESRVEELRKELHEYGALHEEPPLKTIAGTLQSAIDDPELSELWRLGGGLKPEFNSLITDLNSENIVYDYHINDMERRLEIVISSFNLKEILDERGRLATLDKIRGLITKLKTVPKAELPDVVAALSSDLEDVEGIEKLSEIFRGTIKNCGEEMKQELERVSELKARIEAGEDVGSHTTGGKNSRAGGASRGGGASTAKSAKSRGLATSSGTVEAFDDVNVDPISIKSWSRKLGILFYGSDLPSDQQEACRDAFTGMGQQRTCNKIVDEVVSDASSRTLRLMDSRYKKLADRIATFMETQASSMALCTTNTTEFYIVLSKAVEAHRAAQKSLDDKHEDELWDWKEDFRITLEEKESSINEACTKVKQSNSAEEVAVQFEAVLALLQEVEESYRTYHTKACFLSDKYPLSLVNEFKDYQSIVSTSLSMAPKLPHPLISEYDRFLAEIFRLNKQFLEGNADIEVVGSGDEAIRYEVQTAAVSYEDVEEEGKDGAPENTEEVHDEACGETGAGADADADADGEPQIPHFEDYSSMHARSEVWDANAAETNPSDATAMNTTASESTFDMNTIGGKYLVFNDITGIVSLLYEEKEEIEIPEEPVNTDGQDTEVKDEVEPEAEKEEVVVKTLEEFPWLMDTMEVLSSEELSALEADDEINGEYNAYKKKLIKAFIALDEEAIAALSEEQLEQYHAMEATVNATKETLERESDPNYIRANVPKDSHDNNWVMPLNVDSEQLGEMIGNLRDCLIADLEKECHDRVRISQKQCKEEKSEFTEELEDRIRTHWPRRGRVETGIKQPREAELLGHQQKTWRHIESIQTKIIDIQGRFKALIQSSQTSCDDYVNNVANLRNSLTTTTWKSLAALQAVDAKARNTTITYQTSAQKQIKTLQGMINEEVESISIYAIHFLELCPQQEPGKEGGYSASELEEIERYVKGQCDEIISVQKDWSEEVDALKEQQQQSLSTLETFTAQYDKSALELALSEGLGQKYGAPRRRAQEKLRTMVSRDEQSAGKIDELLAKLDFISSEETNRKDDPESSSSIVDSPEYTDAVAGEMEITKATEIWDLLSKVRTAMKKRVEYLEIDQNSPAINEIPWIENGHETTELKPRELPVDDSYHHSLSSGQLKVFFEEVDKDCREETKQLYQSIGREDALGESGIPDSLEKWLTEKREKMLGPGGYHEKAWKRVWSQIGRLEIVLSRKVYESEEEEMLNSGKISGPEVALRYLGYAYKSYVAQERANMEAKFRKVLILLERGREKNERLLRPRLGSPDAIDELNKLDNDEEERSKDLTNAVTSFQDLIARRFIELSKFFLEDIGIAHKALMVYLDSSLRLDSITLPPDTVMPVKMLTLKRLKKALRIKREVAANGGTEDRSKFRTWPSIPVESFLNLLSDAETIIDEKKIPQPEVVAEAPVDPKAKKKAPVKGKSAEPEPSAEKPTMVPSSWLTTLAANTCVPGSVTTGHRVIVKERDAVVASFMEEVHVGIDELKTEYNKVLKQEESWKERWQRQVGMLRSGVM